MLKEKLEEWWISSEFTLTKNQLIAICILASIIAFGWLYYYFNQSHNSAEIKVSKQPQKQKTVKGVLFVHVAGAVKNPGVYKLKSGTRVIGAIKLAGGFNEGADQDSLNLAAKVVDSQKILVAKKLEDKSALSGKDLKTNYSTNGLTNINTADAKDLEELPGIGETIAGRIIEFRKEKGLFSSVGQLKEVEGIGEKKFERIRPKITL